MKKNLVISFPVIETSPWLIGENQRAILLKMETIVPYGSVSLPSHCNVTAMLENGQLSKFTVPLQVWNEAKNNPVHFMEAAEVRGPLIAQAG